MNCGPPGSSVHGILQARILKWVAIASSRGSSWPRDQTHISCGSCTGRRILYHWAKWKPMTNLDSVSKNKDITLLTIVYTVRVLVFSIVMYGCKSWSIKKTEHRRIDAFKLWCWRRLLRIPWTARRSNQSILKKINPKYSLGGLLLKLKFNTLATRCEELTHWKRSWCWERLKAKGEGGGRGLDC